MTSTAISPALACAFIQQNKPNFIPKIGLILGSGLGELATQLENSISIPYANIPGFPISTVPGHTNCLVLGEMGNMPVVCLQGRVHGYEGATSDDFKIFIHTLKLLGCTTLFITNAAGSLRPNVTPGQLMLISDHLNFQHRNPLIGPNDSDFGPRFFPMDNAYDLLLRQRVQAIAQDLKISLSEGVYAGMTGPCFETPAEIRALKILGADAVGMSTIPEVIIARHCGLRVAALSAITNLAAGMSEMSITHEETLHFGQIAAGNMSLLIKHVLKSLRDDPC